VARLFDGLFNFGQ